MIVVDETAWGRRSGRAAIRLDEEVRPSNPPQGSRSSVSVSSADASASISGNQACCAQLRGMVQCKVDRRLRCWQATLQMPRPRRRRHRSSSREARAPTAIVRWRRGCRDAWPAMAGSLGASTRIFRVRCRQGEVLPDMAAPLQGVEQRARGMKLPPAVTGRGETRGTLARRIRAWPP